MGQKTLAFQLFFPRLCQNFNLLVQWTVLMNSFSKNSQLFFWLNGTWQKKFQPFVMNFFGGVVTTSFLRVHSNFWWKIKWQFFWNFSSMSKTEPHTFGRFAKLFLRCSYYSFLLAPRKILIREKSSEKVMIPFLTFCFFGPWAREHLAFSSKTYRLFRQICILRELKLFVETTFFS